MLSLDLPGAAVKLYQVWRQDKELFAWCALVGSTFYSGLVTFLVVGGLSHSLWNGMWSAGCAILSVLLVSPQGRKLTLNFPRQVIEQYQQQTKDGTTTIYPDHK